MWWIRNRKRNISMLEEFVYLTEKGTPVGRDFGKFGDDKLGRLLNRLLSAYRRDRMYKDSMSVQREKVVMDAQENIRRKKQLTQNISHELKTPVSSINGYLDTILSNDDMDRGQMLYFIEKAYGQSQRLTELLNDLSTITRMEEAPEQIEKEECLLSELITEVVADIENSISKEGCSIVCDFPQDMLIMGNRGLLQSIFHNLLENAMLYSQATRIDLQMTSFENGKYTFIIKDNGVGVDPKHLPLLFERFYRVDKGRSRKLGGTGLGLSIVKNAVALHSGEIRAESVKSGGLAFIFTLSR